MTNKPNIIGIGVDTTGSSPMPVTADGTALALKDGFATDPDCDVHSLEGPYVRQGSPKTSTRSAIRVGSPITPNMLVASIRPSGSGPRSLNVGRRNPEVFQAAATWVEFCDWIPSVLTGVDDASKIVRGVCAAGHKALWHPEFGGLPSIEWLTALDPCLGNLAYPMFTETRTSDQSAGGLCEEWAGPVRPESGHSRSRWCVRLPYGGRSVPGSRITRWCVSWGPRPAIFLLPPPEEVGDTLVHGICGQVPGSAMPDSIGFEAGQSSFGDVFAWFERVLSVEPQVKRQVRIPSAGNWKLKLRFCLPAGMGNGRLTG